MVGGEQWLGMIFKEALFGVVNFENAQNLRQFEKIQDWHSLQKLSNYIIIEANPRFFEEYTDCKKIHSRGSLPEANFNYPYRIIDPTVLDCVKPLGVPPMHRVFIKNSSKRRKV